MTKEFMKEAVENLIARGVAKPEDFSPSAVTDEDIAAFERRFQVTMPESLRAYLQTCSFDFEYLAAPIPEDGLDADTILDPDYECSPVMLEITPVPKNDPLAPLSMHMEGFRSDAEEAFVSASPEDIHDMIPIGDWMAGAGTIVLDLSRPESEADIYDEDTWSIRWFDHEELDWKETYADDSGKIAGAPLFPDLQTLLEFYFCGKYDRAYEEQLEEDGEEPPVYSEYKQ